MLSLRLIADEINKRLKDITDRAFDIASTIDKKLGASVTESKSHFEMKLELKEAFPDSPPMTIEAWKEALIENGKGKFTIMLTGSMKANGRGLSAGDARELADALNLAANYAEGLEATPARAMSYMELHDKYIRSIAELDNQRKRAKKMSEDVALSTLQSMLGDFLPVADGLSRALAAIEGQDSQVSTGVRMVAGMFDAALAKNDIVPILAVGETFDPSIHEAIQQIDSDDHNPGQVIQEVERGYMRGDRLLRASRVVVAGPRSGLSETKDVTQDE